jgi:4'-phosphopantetheinyl transferase
VNPPPLGLSELERTLAVDERHRAERFVFDKDRNQYIVGRGMLRVILASYLAREPRDLGFHYSALGKPMLSAEPALHGIRFNVSHAGGVVLHAVGMGREVGVDIERVRADVGTEELATRFFSEREVAALHAIRSSSRLEAFFTCWTRKEAYLKARGDGLSVPLDSFDVTLTPGVPAALVSVKNDPREAARWSIREVLPGPGYVAALAVEGHDWSLQCLQWAEQ